MNGPALIGILATMAILALIYIASDVDSPWPRISFLFAGTIGILALDLPWPATVLIFAFIGGGWAAKRAFDRYTIVTSAWEIPADRPKRGLGEDWRARYGGDSSGGNWGSDRKTGAEAGARKRRSISGDHEEALNILGLNENATDRDVSNAHRRLMKKHHPDRGGSTEMATKLNSARELLLRH